MKGHEHYLAAAVALERSVTYDPETDTSQIDTHGLMVAEVHATLAQAAATALPTVVKYMGDDSTVTGWADAIGHERGRTL